MHWRDKMESSQDLYDCVRICKSDSAALKMMQCGLSLFQIEQPDALPVAP